MKGIIPRRTSPFDKMDNIVPSGVRTRRYISTGSPVTEGIQLVIERSSPGISFDVFISISTPSHEQTTGVGVGSVKGVITTVGVAVGVGVSVGVTVGVGVSVGVAVGVGGG